MIYIYSFLMISPDRKAFALSHMHKEGWEKWHVPIILSALPFFLQIIALLLFFIGLLDLLWHIDGASSVFSPIFLIEGLSDPSLSCRAIHGSSDRD